MRVQLVSLMVFGMVVTASPALAEQNDRDSGPRFLEGALIGTAIPLVVVPVTGAILCAGDSLNRVGCVVVSVLAGLVLTPVGALAGGLIEYLITLPKEPPQGVAGQPSVLLIPAFSGREAASLNLLVRF